MAFNHSFSTSVGALLEQLRLVPLYIEHSLVSIKLIWMEFKLAPSFYWKRSFSGQFRRRFLHAFFTMLGSFEVFRQSNNDRQMAAITRLMSHETFGMNVNEKTGAWKVMRHSRAERISTCVAIEELLNITGRSDAVITALALLFLRCPMLPQDRQVVIATLFKSENHKQAVEKIYLKFNALQEQCREIEQMLQGRYKQHTNSTDERHRRANEHIIEDHKKEVNLAFKTLNLRGIEDEPTVKQRYRDLVKEYHPDRARHKSDCENDLATATQKFREIQMAYEEICAIKGW